MRGYPLISGFADNDVFAWRNGVAITARRFVSDVASTAALLPACKHVVNLCASRYDFTVGWAAAMVRGQVSLLPPNDTPGTLTQLVEDHPDIYCLADRPVAAEGMMVLPFPESQASPDNAAQIPVLAVDRIAALLFTSGSTGRPKPQARTWGTFVRSTRAAGARLDVSFLRGATLVGTVPHQHSYGIESTVLLALQHGIAMQDCRPMLPGDIAAALDDASRPRILVTAPIHLKTLLAGEQNLPACDLVLSATAPLPPQLARQAEAAFAAPLHEIYGCSEAGQLATRRTALTAEWQSLDGVTLRQDGGATWARADANGDEILLNDVLEIIDNEHFLLHGRTADLVNIAGKRSSLAHLTYHLNRVPGVIDGAFVLPEPDAGRLMAFAVAPGVTSETILKALRHHIDPAFLPRPLCVVEALPRNDLGKLPREAVLGLAATAKASMADA